MNRKAPAKPTWCVAQRGAAPCSVVISSVIYSNSFYMSTEDLFGRTLRTACKMF